MEQADHRTSLSGIGVVLTALAGAILAGRLLRGQPAIVGHEAPEFSLAVVANGASVGGDGSNVTVGQLRGHAVLLDFWATWCRYCRAEAPRVDGLARRWHDKGLVVLGVSTDRPDEGDPAAYARAHGMSFPIVRDSLGTASRAYGVQSLPTVVVLSSAGKVVGVREGVVSDDELEHLISEAL